jgi:hypothetical protein
MGQETEFTIWSSHNVQAMYGRIGLNKLIFMDTFAFASLAHFCILLVPVGAIPRTTYERLAAEIKSFESIRLKDILSDAKDERGGLSTPHHNFPLLTGHKHVLRPTRCLQAKSY